QRPVRLKADGAFARAIVLEFLLERTHRGGIHRVKRAVIRPRANSYQRLAVEAKGRQSVADALFRLRSGGLDGFAKFLERDSLVFVQACEVLVNGLGYGAHGSLL